MTTAAYVHNRVVISSTGIIPFERWYKKKPDVSHLDAWDMHLCLTMHERRHSVYALLAMVVHLAPRVIDF